MEPLEEEVTVAAPPEEIDADDDDAFLLSKIRQSIDMQDRKH